MTRKIIETNREECIMKMVKKTAVWLIVLIMSMTNLFVAIYAAAEDQHNVNLEVTIKKMSCLQNMMSIYTLTIDLFRL